MRLGQKQELCLCAAESTKAEGKHLGEALSVSAGASLSNQAPALGAVGQGLVWCSHSSFAFPHLQQATGDPKATAEQEATILNKDIQAKKIG